MLCELSKALAGVFSFREKNALLDSFPKVQKFFASQKEAFQVIQKWGEDRQVLLKQLIAIDQAFPLLGKRFWEKDGVQDLLDTLLELDYFYREIGGIVGYQEKVLSLLQKEKKQGFQEARFHPPVFRDISEETEGVKEAIQAGIDSLPFMAEIYPLGGAADRLHLVSEKGEELPAAKLPFCGRTLLEGLIRDVQAREALYFAKHGVQLVTPIAIMTSFEKKNHEHVLKILEENHMFGRPKDSIRVFTQPLVPTIDEEGKWCLKGPLSPLFKPGGHGAIWKVAKDKKIFDWLASLGRTKAIVRQINNPLAGLDYGLIAFYGIGFRESQIFGFASCPRLLRSAEGVNVLVETKGHLVLSNIEYCDFAKYGIEDRPLKKEDSYSRFSSNTNILFVDLEAVSKAVEKNPFPGLLVNLKKGSFQDAKGEKKVQMMARLESTMQNIADVFEEEKGRLLDTRKTFVSYNHRHKTISTTKRGYIKGKELKETPENCLYDLLKAHRELLESCGYLLPPERGLEEYLEKGPEVFFQYHPALGPLYADIRKRLQGGALGRGAELILEIADLSAKNLQLEGSLQIIAEEPLGKIDSQGILHFQKQRASCLLENVTIRNRGVMWGKSEPFWKGDFQRKETVKIILRGKSRFIARDICLEGSHTFEVKDGECLKIL